jgi:hypothetical protein
LESRRIRKEVLELNAKHPPYGYRRITALMRREGFEVNGADSTRRRNQSQQETTPHEAIRTFNGRAAAR